MQLGLRDEWKTIFDFPEKRSGVDKQSGCDSKEGARETGGSVVDLASTCSGGEALTCSNPCRQSM